MPLDADAKKVLLRKIPHGLFVCGVREGDEVNGFTASWVTQGSFEPPLVVMGVRADSTSHGIIERTGRFSLNVMRADQKDLVAVFFKPQKAMGGRFDAAPFQRVSWASPAGGRDRRCRMRTGGPGQPWGSHRVRRRSEIRPAAR